MNENNDSEPSSGDSEQVPFFKRIKAFLAFDRSPGTTEALEHEIQELLEEGEEHGLISSLEERMITSIFDIRDTLAAEIMTPAAEITSFEVSTEISVIIEAVIRQGYTRIPIYKENTDDIIGILHAKDLLRLCTQGAPPFGGLAEFLNPVYLVPEDKPIVDLLKEFQKKKIHMAIVMDEFGAVRGLLTLEDILEEIVGEIDDESDTDDDDFEQVDEQTYLVRGRDDIEDVEERLKISLPEGPYESIGGLIIHALGRLGVEGDSVMVGDVELIVHVAGNRKIKKVKIVVPGQQSAD